jgi:hypothetical protein
MSGFNRTLTIQALGEATCRPACLPVTSGDFALDVRIASLLTIRWGI